MCKLQQITHKLSKVKFVSAGGRKIVGDSCSWNLSKCKTFSPANQIARNKHNDEELELFWHTFVVEIYM